MKKVWVIVEKAECGNGTFLVGVYSTLKKSSKALDELREDEGLNPIESLDASKYSRFETIMDYEE